MDITITVCDVCEDSGREARRYSVTDEASGRTAITDRCDTHGAELEAILGTKPPPRRPSGTRPGTTRPSSSTPKQSARRTRIATMAEVEAARK